MPDRTSVGSYDGVSAGGDGRIGKLLGPHNGRDRISRAGGEPADRDSLKGCRNGARAGSPTQAYHNGDAFDGVEPRAITNQPAGDPFRHLGDLDCDRRGKHCNVHGNAAGDCKCGGPLDGRRSGRGLDACRRRRWWWWGHCVLLSPRLSGGPSHSNVRSRTTPFLRHLYLSSTPQNRIYFGRKGL